MQFFVLGSGVEAAGGKSQRRIGGLVCQRNDSTVIGDALGQRVVSTVQVAFAPRDCTRPHSRDEFASAVIEASKLILIIPFCELFELLMDRFFRTAVASLPEGLGSTSWSVTPPSAAVRAAFTPCRSELLEATWRASAMAGLHIQEGTGQTPILCTAMRPRSKIRSSGKPSSDCVSCRRRSWRSSIRAAPVI
jgi:hypothetical protein